MLSITPKLGVMLRPHSDGPASVPVMRDAHRQDPHDHENLPVGVNVDLCAARDLNPEPAG
jgi:hypothetical protein